MDTSDDPATTVPGHDQGGETLRRVFVVGPTRSGTSLVQRVLAEQFDLVAIPETHYLDGTFRRIGCMTRVRRSSKVEPFGIARRPLWFDEAAFLRLLNRLRSGRVDPVTFTHAVFAPLDDVARRAGAVGWVEKTPGHVRFVGLLRAAYPDAVIIHLRRDPAAAVASRVTASQQWGRPRGWWQSYLQWLVAAWIGVIRTTRYQEHLVDFDRFIDADGQLPEPVRRAVAPGSEPAGDPGTAHGPPYGDDPDRVSVDANLAHLDLASETWRSNALRPVDRRHVTTSIDPSTLNAGQRAALALAPGRPPTTSQLITFQRRLLHRVGLKVLGALVEPESARA